MPALAFAGTSDAADAAQRNDIAALRGMVSKRVDVNAPQPDGTTALHWAAHWNDVEAVKLLIRRRREGDHDQPVRRLAAFRGSYVRQCGPRESAARCRRGCKGAVYA